MVARGMVVLSQSYHCIVAYREVNLMSGKVTFMNLEKVNARPQVLYSRRSVIQGLSHTEFEPKTGLR
ncbi:hypothetical protein Plhal304r1_c010g0040141 [Plasmopara halstedii]